ncbi:MAG: cell division protein FtsA [Lachnospiraceae bacterium]
MMLDLSYSGHLVFGLDIGTRSIVGTVGYKEEDRFIVIAQAVKEHETRAMLDGQIHDINRVGETILVVKKELEEKIKRKLTHVCIAAAGRVLETVQSSASILFDSEKIVEKEDIYELESKGVEQAYEEFLEKNELDMKFYCVGNSVIKYYLDELPMGNLEHHKAKKIAVDLIATFLPEDVVDGLYKAVEIADLEVENLTLEPIAAIQVAIPERFRLLNIALVDVGAGTSDICITRDGSIVAYGMIPVAGDSLTEVIAKHCLTDFNTADYIKKKATTCAKIEYEDIMGLKQVIESSKVEELIEETMENMSKLVANKILELNGDKAVSAIFVVGGGGKVAGYTKKLSELIGIPSERVAIRGEDVLGKVEFLDPFIIKDSLLITPIGICLNFYNENNNFIFVTFNKNKVKLYDNGKLTVMDAALYCNFPKDGFFPKTGKEVEYTINGKTKIHRGYPGEAAKIEVNGNEANLYTKIKKDDIIKITESTAGESATVLLGELPEFKEILTIFINDKKITVPKFASVNGNLQSEFYKIKTKDEIELLNYYTLEQLLDFVDVNKDMSINYFVNNTLANMETKIFENFTVSWGNHKKEIQSIEKVVVEPIKITESSNTNKKIRIHVNGKEVILTGKQNYIFVDIFDFIPFDLSKPKGAIVTTVNKVNAQFMEPLKEGDFVEIYWREE